MYEDNQIFNNLMTVRDAYKGQLVKLAILRKQKNLINLEIIGLGCGLIIIHIIHYKQAF